MLKFAFFIPGAITDRDEHSKIRPIPLIHCHENAWKLHIWPVSLSQNGVKTGKRTINHDPNVISSKGGQDTSACQILGHSSHAFSRKFRKPQIWPVPLSQNCAKMKNINIPWPKSNLLWRWSENINMPNFRPFLPCVCLKKMPGNLKFCLLH